MVSRSPFPGMDPWRESHWGDVHHRIIQYGSDQIASQLPGGLYAAVEETVYLMDEGEQRRRLRPDVAVFDAGGERREGSTSRGAVGVAEPMLLRVPDDPVTLGHIEIRDARRRDRLVTAIEVISPTNKCNIYGRAQYLQKRREFHDSGASVVEIDLLRAGELIVDLHAAHHPDIARLKAPYCCCIRRGFEHGVNMREFYPLSLRKPLPKIALPLRPTDADIVFDLQATLDEAYDKGRYAMRLDYQSPPLASSWPQALGQGAVTGFPDTRQSLCR